MTTANPDTFAARITMSGGIARRLRHEALYGYSGAADSIDHSIATEVDFAELFAARARLAALDDMLTDLGWDRDIADDATIALVAPAELLKSLIDPLLESAATEIQDSVTSDIGRLDKAIDDVRAWRDLLEQVHETATGEDID